MSDSRTESKKEPMRIAMTLNCDPATIDEYIDHHAHSRPEVRSALTASGLQNLSVWVWEDRLFYYAEYVGSEPFDVAMEKYAAMPGVAEWEALMHKYQVKIPGSKGDVWWQRCKQVYHQD